LDRKGVVSSDDVDASQRRQNDVLSSNRPGIGALSDIAASEAALSNFDFLKTEIEDEDGTDPSSVSQYRQLNIVEAYTQNESDKDPLMKRKKITRGSSKKGSLKEVIASLQAEYEKTSSTDTTFNGGSNASETASRTAPLDHITICINRMEGDPNVLGDLATVTPANETEGVNNPMEDLSFARNCKPDSNYTDFPKLIIGNNRSEKSQSFKSGRPNNNNNSSEEDQQGYQGDMSNLLQSRNDERPHWTLRHTLRSHWDAVRTLSFHPDSYACLVTGGDDGCLMLWSMEPDAINASAIARNWLTSIPSTTASESGGDDSHFKLSGGDLLPTHSIRAHDGPILSSLVFSFYSGGTPLACSGGLDGNLSVWLLPPGAWVPYESETLKEDVDGNQFADLATTMLPSRLTFTSEHTDAVWGLSSVCLSNGETLIASAGAEGVVKLWSLSTGENGSDEDIQLCCRHSFSLNQDWNLAPEDAPTSLAFVSGGSRLIIGAKSGTLLIVDTQTSQLLFSQFASTEEDESRVYTVAAHNTLPLAVAGLENGHLCFLDTQSASIIQNTVAHQQTVSSVAFEPQGLYFATASHDQSLRLWDVTSRSCVQEMHAHRSKFDESSLAVAFHPRLPLMASAGADSIVNVYSSAFSFSSTI
jgi:WD40 repeat protein